MIQTLIVSLSAFTMGIVGFLATNNVRRGRKARGGEKRLNYAYASARFGFIILVLLVAEAVYNAPTVPITWRVLLYAFGLTMVAGGYLGIAVEGRRRPERGRRGERDPRLPGDPRDLRDPRDPRLPGDPRDPRDVSD